MSHSRYFCFAQAFVLLASWEIGLRPCLSRLSQAEQVAPTTEKDLDELIRMHAEDQGDREIKDGSPINWLVVGPRDKARLARVRELYLGGHLHSGPDYYHAAMILQHGGNSADYLLAHEFCVVAIGRGERRAKWLAAASEDRYLTSLKRPQRFGTQYSSTGPNAPFQLDKIEEGMTDGLRREFNVPTIEAAKAREAEMNR